MERDSGPGERSPNRGGTVPLGHQETRAPEGRIDPDEPDLVTEDDGAGMAGGSSGATGGSSGTPGHPDAPR